MPYLQTALNARPDVVQYWLSLIAALIDCGEEAAAGQVLAQGQARGLQGEAVEALARRLDGATQAAPAPAGEQATPAPQSTAEQAPSAAAAEAASKVSPVKAASRSAKKAAKPALKLGKSAAEWLARAKQAQQAGKVADARLFVELAIRRDHDYLDGWFFLARLH
ncbi:hypothetical protein GWK36_06610 [Caldichromatium japonicum]|uniref:Uncharacterized protein n=1 Tax=Caldichromatium japonicum TaxID=2699430 RepID=A0A6G7VD41_9GAMM|nr:hypothetical protein [Caldichromatium japonicum]QIK37707.1 hypothetical protein GWK36_06610 [Caldichromatium japonicum]